jgi:hypothetical protein
MLRPTTDIEQKVAAGAAFLDRACPGWESHINTATLDINDGYHCVLGQLARVEWNIPERPLIAWERHDLVSLGFWPRENESTLLTQAWRVEITNRRLVAA